MEVGENRNRDDARQAVRQEPGRRPGLAQPVIDAVGQNVLAVHSQPEAGDRDAELRGGDVAILQLRVAQELLDRLRQHVSARGPRIDRRARRADDRELRRDEDPVEQDQRRR